MKRLSGALLAIIALPLLLGSCGGSTKTVVQTVTAGTATTSTSATTRATTTTNTGPPDCSSIDSRTFVGKCTSNGATFTFANPGSTVALKTLKVKVVNVATADSVSNGSGFTANAHGTFVIVSIAVTNTTQSPQTFDEGSSTSQAALRIGNNTYSVSFDAENTNDPNSFVTNDAPIQPGETRTGTIDFDVPSSAAARVNQHGGLVVVDFGETLDSAQSAAVLKFFQP